MLRKYARGYGAATGFLLLLNAVYFFPVLAKGNRAVLSAAGTDTWLCFFYWRSFAYQSLARGEMPLWNPHVFSGTPFVAGIQSAIFYPLNLVFLLFSTPLAINVSIALHCLLASLFTYAYARYIGISQSGALISGVSFAYGAPFFLHILPGHLAPLSAMIWLPLLFLGVEAFVQTAAIRFMLLSGIVLALQVLAGYPQYLFYSVLTVSVYLCVRVWTRTELRVVYALSGYALFLLTGALLSAVQLLPTAEFTRYSFRENLTYEWVAIFSLPPEKLVTLLIPDFFGNALDVPYWGKNYFWEMSVYVGVIPLALAAMALLFDCRRKVIFFFSIAIAALILALGKYTPLLTILFNFVPGFDRFRGLSKFVFVFSFATAVLAGFGLSKLTALALARDGRLAKTSYVLLGLPVLLIILSAAGPFLERGWWHSLIEFYSTGEDRFYNLPRITDEFVTAATSAAFRSLLTTCGLFAFLGTVLLLSSKVKKLSAFLPGAILLLAVADLWHFGFRYLVEFSPEELSMDKGLKAFLKNDPEPFRVASPLSQVLNVGLYEDIENVGGYDTLVLKKYTEFINFAQRFPMNQPSTDTRVRTGSPLLNLLNVKYFIRGASTRIEQPGFQMVFENQNYRVYLNPYALPRSYIVHDVRVIEDRDEVLRQMASPEFNPASAAIVKEKIEYLTPDASVKSPPPRFLKRSSNRVVLEANLNGAGLLVLADTFYPGWKCFVDGQESKIYEANYIMRSVFVPAGRHRVEFNYDPWSFKIGALISIVTLVLLSWGLWWTAPPRSKS